jgi:ABC-type phosphate/phosphonate transport system substrate-binding protein
MLASLGMYDLPEARGATTAWWQGLARAFRAEGIADAPEQLTANPEYPAHWLRPDLLFGQTCGYPLTHALAGKVRLVATPRYAARGCSGSSYCSLLIVAEDSAAATLEDLRGARLAFNGPESQSGYNVLRAMVAPLARPGTQGGRFFGATIETGGHRASIAAIGAGRADICAVDCVTHAMLARHAPAALAGTRVLGETPSAPGLPFVTAGAASDELVARLQAGLARALADPTLAAARDDLLIAGAEVVPLGAYDVLVEMEQAATAAGYGVLV